MSAASAAARRRETGPRGATFCSINPEPVTTELLESTKGELRRLLAPSLDALFRDDRNRMQQRLRIRDRHPIAVCLTELDRTIDNLHTSDPILHAPSYTEGRALIHFLRRWENDPRWPALLSGVVHDYVYTLFVITSACLLEDIGNAVEFVTESRADGVQTPDLRVVSGVGQFAAVEIKTPGRT